MTKIERQKLISILDSIEDGIYIIDTDYTLEFMNKAMIKDFGEGIGKKCYETINNCDEICPWCRICWVTIAKKNFLRLI
jgi:PAS domain-containing protein